MMKNLMGGGDGMMKQVRQMQEELKRAQKELEKETVTGSAGGGVIEVVMTGSQKCQDVKLDGSKVKDMKPENLQALLKMAVNDALDKSRKLMAKKIGPLSGGLGGLGGLR
jgi:DNA-binding YbaB/EbfC family protein